MNNIRAAREMRGVKQKDLAEAMKTAPSTISLYEKGKREPSISMLCKMAQYLNVTVGYHAKVRAEKKPVAISDERDVKTLELFRQLSKRNTQRVLDYATDLLAVQDANSSDDRSSV